MGILIIECYFLQLRLNKKSFFVINQIKKSFFVINLIFFYFKQGYGCFYHLTGITINLHCNDICMLIFPLKIIHQNKDSFEQSILIISHVHLALQLLTLSPSQISLIVSDIFTVCSSFCLYINPFCDNIIERCYDSNKCRNYPDIIVVLSLLMHSKITRPQNLTF